MKPLAIAALCAGLAAPLVTKAADLVLFDSTGRPVAVVMPADAAATMTPTDIFAQQDAMLDRMVQTMARMNAAFMSGPLSMDPAALGSAGPGSTVIMTSFSDGRSSCSRTVTYDQRSGSSPIVQVRQTGDGCGAMPAPSVGGTVPAALPPSEAVPGSVTPANPNSPQLIHVAYRHPVAKPRPHHL